MSTIAPQTSIAPAGQAAERGIHVLDAPVAGGEACPVDGTLSITVGGEAAGTPS